MTEEKKAWKGKELAEDLARSLQSENWMVWVEIPLGSVFMDSSVKRADVLAVSKSFANPVVKIYEVKVARGDFLGDINRMKYSAYLNSANQVYFAVPQGLVKAAELPQDGVGLITRGDSSWHVVKAARRQDFKLNVEFLLKLLMRGYEDHWKKYRSAEIREHEAKTYTTLKQALHDYGVKVAGDIAQAQEIKELSATLLKEIGELLGKDFSNCYDAVAELQRSVGVLQRQYRYSRLAVHLAELTMRLYHGETIWGSPIKQLEQILEVAKKDFPTKIE